MELNFTDESWDDPGPSDPSAEVAVGGENPATQESQNRGGEDVKTLKERWQLTQSRDPPAWADKEDMERRGARTEGIQEEVPLYCPSRDLEP